MHKLTDSVLCIFYLIAFSFFALHFVIESKSSIIEYQVYVGFIYFLTLANFVLLLLKFYRKYNLYCLLEDIIEIRQNNLSKIETFQVFVLLACCLTFVFRGSAYELPDVRDGNA